MQTTTLSDLRFTGFMDVFSLPGLAFRCTEISNYISDAHVFSNWIPPLEPVP